MADRESENRRPVNPLQVHLWTPQRSKGILGWLTRSRVLTLSALLHGFQMPVARMGVIDVEDGVVLRIRCGDFNEALRQLRLGALATLL
jgi:hypothetical protein